MRLPRDFIRADVCCTRIIDFRGFASRQMVIREWNKFASHLGLLLRWRRKLGRGPARFSCLNFANVFYERGSWKSKFFPEKNPCDWNFLKFGEKYRVSLASFRGFVKSCTFRECAIFTPKYVLCVGIFNERSFDWLLYRYIIKSTRNYN